MDPCIRGELSSGTRDPRAYPASRGGIPNAPSFRALEIALELERIEGIADGLSEAEHDSLWSCWIIDVDIHRVLKLRDSVLGGEFKFKLSV